MKKIVINDKKYELISDSDKVFNEEELSEKATDYFENFDYIFGDYAYDKLRLKGFYESNSNKVTKINDIKLLDEYIKNYCAYGAKWFLLKKIN